MEGSKEKDIYGLLGMNISYSLSPAMHNAAFRHYGINAEYGLFDMGEGSLRGFFSSRVLEGGIRGFNVTVPYKMKAREMLGDMAGASAEDEWVELTGSVNTVKLQKDKVAMYNTDVSGFARSLKEEAGFEPSGGKGILLLGAGGAGRAICIYLGTLGSSVKIRVFDPDTDRTASLEDYFRDKGLEPLCVIGSREELPEIMKECGLVINATPLGTRKGDMPPVPLEALQSGMVIYDLVYARETELVKSAKDKGLKAVDGRDMLVNQGALAFNIWTGKPVEEVKQVMKEALHSALEGVE